MFVRFSAFVVRCPFVMRVVDIYGVQFTDKQVTTHETDRIFVPGVKSNITVRKSTVCRVCQA